MAKHVLLVGLDTSAYPLAGPETAESGAFQFQGVNNPSEALAALAQTPYDAVVANWTLPGKLGVLLLDEVLRRHPNVQRFIRADLRDQASAMLCLGTPHHLLLDPITPQSVQGAIEEALAMERWLPSEGVRKLLPRLTNVPSPPELYFAVAQDLQSSDVSLEDIGQKIAQDPAMTAKLLQLVNSAVFGLQMTVSEPGQAVSYLGVERTKSLILLAHTFSYFDHLKMPGFSIELLWHHSATVGRCAQAIAAFHPNTHELAASAYTGGLLHDLGKLILAANAGEEFQEAWRRATTGPTELWQAELEVLGTHHAEIGACLLAAWGLPEPIVQAVALHHHPVRLSEEGAILVAAVHAANVFSRTAAPDRPQPASPPLDQEFLEALGLAEQIGEWARCRAADRASKVAAA